MALLLYNLGLLIALALMAPIWVAWLVLSKKARAGLRQKLSLYPERFVAQLQAQQTQFPSQQPLWFHTVSVGEFNAIRQLVKTLQTDMPVVISTTTRTANQLACKTFPELPVFYFPYDVRPLIFRAIQTVRPARVVVVETELWPNFIDVVTRRTNTPLILINGRLSLKSFKGYRFIRFLIRPVLQKITHCYMQTSDDAERIIALGADPAKVTIAGNLKFDVEIPKQASPEGHALAHLLNIQPTDTVMTLASTHTGEDEPLIGVYQTLKKDFPELKLIVVPRHPERVPDVCTILNRKALAYRLRSQLSTSAPNDDDIVILDTIGELLTVFELSTLAVMGGSFTPRGGQNPLEPLSRNVPVIFGPHMFNFKAITRQILEQQAGFQVTEPEAIVDLATELLTQPEIASHVTDQGQHLLEANQGTLQRLSGILQQGALKNG